MKLWIAAAMIAVSAHAQVDPSILQQPWLQPPHWAQTYDDLFITDQGHTKRADLNTSIFWWDSTGRIKPDRHDSNPDLVIGYTILANDVDSSDRRLNGMMWDIAIVAGGPVGKLGNDWDVAVLGGLGTRNDGHWSDGRTLYGVGAVNFAHKLDDRQSLHAGLFYNGNSLLLPDYPLPYASYVHVVDEKLSYTFGVPRSALRYRPIEPVILELSYFFPVDATARAEWVLVENFRLFAQYSQNTDAVHIDGTKHRRLFYEVRRVLGGVRWITKWLDASVGVGYTLDHQFRSGFDLRDTDKVADLSEVPFAALILQGTF